MPDFEHMHNQGPIPRGRYRIGHAEYHPKLGSYAMSLTPVSHYTHGRTGFYIHGDSIKFPGTASTGCIILPLDIRKKIAESGDIDLHVVR
jgi:hypothetical protein